jgi:signal transduction histidine kinase/ligand-binding sensor domain-containing protein
MPVAENRIARLVARGSVFLWGGVLLLLLGSSLSANAERLPLKYYTTADGLPHNAINKIVRDSRGFLWFCTDDGLARFDGYAFTIFGVDQGLPKGSVNDLLEGREGQYWVATSGGLVRFDPPSASDVESSKLKHAIFTVIPADDEDARARNITVLFKDKAGTIWCGSAKGLCQVTDPEHAPRLRFVEIGIPHQYPEQSMITDIVQDTDDSLWIGTFSGLYRRATDGRARRFTIREGLPDDIIHSLLRDHLGRLWAGTRTEGFFQFEAVAGGQITVPRHFQLRETVPQGWIFQLYETSDHRFWVAANVGLLEFLPDAARREPKFRVYSTQNGLSYREVTALSEDVSGNLWLGTNTAGAMKLARSGFVTYSEQDGVLSANDIFEDQAGNLCIKGALPLSKKARRKGDPDFGCFNGRQLTAFNVGSIPSGRWGMGWVLEQVTLHRRNGEWWLGTGSGVYRFSAMSKFEQVASAHPMAHYAINNQPGTRTVYRLFEDSQGNVWVSTISALGDSFMRWESVTRTWTNLGSVSGFPPPHQDLVRSFAEDNNGNVWIGFNGLLARSTHGHFSWFGPDAGVPPGIIRNMHCDRAGRLWLASAESGLVRVDDLGSNHPRFAKFTTVEGLSSNRVEVITEDLYGHIYVGTGRALDRLDPITGRIRHFTTADGLAPGLFRAAYRDRNGALWFGMTGGLSRLEPSPDLPPTSLPIFITAIAAGSNRREVFPFGEQNVRLSELAHTDNQLQIDFVALDFTPGEALRYQYELAGSVWSAPSEERSLSFAKLAPGRYRILLQAVSANGTVSAAPASVQFRILPPLWWRWWFIALLAGAVAALAYVAYRYRMAQILEIANVRARIATDLHDDIGSNLTRIAILSEVARQHLGTADSRQQDDPLSSIADISRESIASMSDIVWAINPQRDRLLDLVRRMRLHAEQLFTARGVKLNFQAPAEEEDVKLRSDTRRDLFLIFKEAINNIARHAACSEVIIAFQLRGDRLVLDVSDNGVGFDPSTISDGLGLTNMRRRAERLGGTCEIRVGPEGKTTVHAVVPAGTLARPTSTGR